MVDNLARIMRTYKAPFMTWLLKWNLEFVEKRMRSATMNEAIRRSTARQLPQRTGDSTD